MQVLALRPDVVGRAVVGVTDLERDLEQARRLRTLTSEARLEVELWLLWLHDLDARTVRLEERRELEAGEPLCMCAGAGWSDA